jgi:PAS domain S-box-containing protein
LSLSFSLAVALLLLVFDWRSRLFMRNSRLQKIKRQPTQKTKGERLMIHAELCQKIVEESQDAIIFADREGVIRMWNVGATALFVYQARETLGQSLDLIIPERQRQRHWDGYRNVMATGASRYGRELLAVPAVRKDGTRISVEFTIMMVRDATGNLQGTAAIMREVTERRQREKAQSERIAALEAAIAARTDR